jgi:N-acetylmuramoyl-L-alanine amidase
MFRFSRNSHCFVLAVLLLVACSLVSAAWSTAFAAKRAIATDIEIVAKGETTRFFAELSKEAGFTAKVVAAPYRVVIELDNVGFDLPAGAGHKPVGLILQVRYGKAENGSSQIVIDTAGPVLIKRSQILPKKGRAKPKIAIDLVSTTEAAFAATFARDEEASSPEATASLPIIMPSAKPGDVPAVRGANKKHIIVLDPGHGGIDPGAVSPNKTKEKDVVFAFATDLAAKLNETGLYDVRMTRDEDRFMTLPDRVNFTRKAGADLFIAIHADTVRGQTVTGTTLYTLSETASDEEAEALAQKENKVDLIAGLNLAEQEGEVADVLINLVQRESKNLANLFSRKALDDLRGVTTMTGKPIRSAGFVVLKSPDVPSVLIELGYLSSKSDEDRLKNPAWRARMAAALTKAIGRHFTAIDAAEQP